MTTQELKNNIEKVLGNSIRCLLPSYWWKKLFHSVADRIDEVEAIVSDMVVKSLKEFETKYPNMASNTLYFTEDETSAEARSNATKLLKWVFSITDKPSGTIGNTLYVAVPIFEGEYNTFSYVIQSPAFRLAARDNAEAILEFLNVPMSDGQSYNIVFGINSGFATLKPASSSSGGGSIIVDSELSDTSENPVQNKAVTNELNTKVDKVEGKQLSTEDFTTPLKEKLEGLSPFDPTEINNAIEGLQDSFDALVSGNTSAAIESFNEFVAFLNGITDSQTLAGIVASLEQMIAAKQDKINDLDAIRSGAALGATAIQQVKTINGEEITGEGNIEIKGDADTSSFATKEELQNLTNEIIDNEEVLAAALNDLNDKKADKSYVVAAIDSAIIAALNTEV